MEISDKTRLEQPTTIQQLNYRHSQDSDSQQSELDSPTLGMTVVLNDSNPYWANDAALRCASNSDLSSVDHKCRRDFKFQVSFFILLRVNRATKHTHKLHAKIWMIVRLKIATKFGSFWQGWCDVFSLVGLKWRCSRVLSPKISGKNVGVKGRAFNFIVYSWRQKGEFSFWLEISQWGIYYVVNSKSNLLYVKKKQLFLCGVKTNTRFNWLASVT